MAVAVICCRVFFFYIFFIIILAELVKGFSKKKGSSTDMKVIDARFDFC